MLSSNVVRVGIAGCGWIAENAHIPALRKVDNVEVTSLFDLSTERAANLAAKYDISGVYQDYDSFLTSGVDAVVICTPNHTHAELSIKALKSGVHVLCEKPVAINFEEISNIVAAAKSRGKIFVPGFVNRFREDIQYINELVLKNEIGRINCVKAGWIRKNGMPRPGTWFTNKRYSGGGVLIDLGSHIIDICLMLLKDKTPEKAVLHTGYDANAFNASANWFVTGEKGELPVDVESAALAEVELTGGTSMEVELSWSKPVENDYTYFNLYGDSGEIQLKTLFGFSSNRLWKEDILTVKKNSKIKEVNLNRETNNSKKAFEVLADYYIRRIRGEKSDFLNEDDGVKAVRLIEELYKSEEL
ncbi:MAG TPA: Gfo/Idh/MocA family oxidoreductase [Clostridia bacterium]|nr:Gfo/Idh/MocA family oxidoreductase [Clostridia bacterium]